MIYEIYHNGNTQNSIKKEQSFFSALNYVTNDAGTQISQCNSDILIHHRFCRVNLSNTKFLCKTIRESDEDADCIPHREANQYAAEIS